MVKLCFSLISAYQAGYTAHPKEVMNMLGYTEILEWVPYTIGDCIYMTVPELKGPLPDFLDEVKEEPDEEEEETPPPTEGKVIVCMSSFNPDEFNN